MRPNSSVTAFSDALKHLWRQTTPKQRALSAHVSKRTIDVVTTETDGIVKSFFLEDDISCNDEEISDEESIRSDGSFEFAEFAESDDEIEP